MSSVLDRFWYANNLNTGSTCSLIEPLFVKRFSPSIFLSFLSASFYSPRCSYFHLENQPLDLAASDIRADHSSISSKAASKRCIILVDGSTMLYHLFNIFERDEEEFQRQVKKGPVREKGDGVQLRN